jgi:DNA polymerase III epsilon subunit-like protein
MANIFVGLDGEMTSADLSAGGRLIQLGLAFGTEPEERITVLIGWEEGQFLAEPKAMEVHGIPLETILKAPRAPEVDDRLYDFARRNGAKEDRRSLIAVGWNVGTFDLPFVKQALPRTYSLLSRRSVDLNAVCFAFGGALFHSGSRPGWTGFKRMSKRAAEDRMQSLGIDPAWHDAGYDALAGLLALEYLRSCLDPA